MTHTKCCTGTILILNLCYPSSHVSIVIDNKFELCILKRDKAIHVERYFEEDNNEDEGNFQVHLSREVLTIAIMLGLFTKPT